MAATYSYFGTELRRKLIENKLAGREPSSIRQLSRVMAKGNDGLAETYRTSLLRWSRLDGPRPSPPSLAVVGEALDIPPVQLEQPDEEEEAASMAPLSRAEFEMLGHLMARLGPTLSAVSETEHEAVSS